LLGPRFQFPGWQPCLPLFFSFLLFLLDASARPSWWIPAAAAAAATFLLLYTDNHGSWTEGLGIHHLVERQINISEDGGGGGTEPVRYMPLACFKSTFTYRKKKAPTDIFISSTKHTFYYYSFILLTSQCRSNSNRERERRGRKKQAAALLWRMCALFNFVITARYPSRLWASFASNPFHILIFLQSFRCCSMGIYNHNWWCISVACVQCIHARLR
jgi:hypothetical protein